MTITITIMFPMIFLWFPMISYDFPMISCRYWSHIQDFQKNGSSYLFDSCLFQHVQNLEFQYFDTSDISFFKTVSWIIWSYLVHPKLEIFGFGAHWHVRNPKIMRMKVLEVFPKRNQQITNPKWHRIILRSFWVIQSFKLVVKMVPRPPQTPNQIFLLDSHRSPIRPLMRSLARTSLVAQMCGGT